MNFNLKEYTVLLVLGGSRAYGTYTPTSDLDIKGILIPPIREYRFGTLHKLEQVDSIRELAIFNDLLSTELLEAVRLDSLERHPDVIAPEGSIYDISKYFAVALDANPNILEIAWSPDENILLEESAGRRIRENRSLFLSKKVVHSYRGYAFSQMKRLRAHRAYLLNPPTKEPTREDFGLPIDRALLSHDDQDAFLWVLARVLEDKLGWYRLSESTREELKAISIKDAADFGIPDKAWPAIQAATGATDNFISVMMKERKYKSARREWEAYRNWDKTRNLKRKELEAKFGYDTKFGSHVVRLYLQAKDILEKEVLNVKLPPEQRELVIATRNGAFTFDQLEEWFEKESEALDQAAQSTKLPHSPDRVKADQLLMELHDEALYHQSLTEIKQRRVDKELRQE